MVFCHFGWNFRHCIPDDFICQASFKAISHSQPILEFRLCHKIAVKITSVKIKTVYIPYFLMKTLKLRNPPFMSTYIHYPAIRQKENLITITGNGLIHFYIIFFILKYCPSPLVVVSVPITQPYIKKTVF